MKILAFIETKFIFGGGNCYCLAVGLGQQSILDPNSGRSKESCRKYCCDVLHADCYNYFNPMGNRNHQYLPTFIICGLE